MIHIFKALSRVLIFVLLILFVIPAITPVNAASQQKLDSKYTKYAQFIVINKSTNKLTYYEKGKAIKTFSVATGMKPSYTPEGLFKIHEKTKNRPYYKERIKGGDPKNPLGDRWLGINVKVNGRMSYAYAIHGNNNEASIGKYVSQGCIRMHNKEVRWLFDKVKMNSPVLIQK